MAAENDVKHAKEHAFFGWIPILTYQLLPVSCLITTPLEKRVSDTDTQKISYTYFWENNHITGIKIHYSDNSRSLTINVKCEVFSTGLVKYSFVFYPDHEYSSLYVKHIAAIIFDIIRDVYHEHVHHDTTDDVTLPPIETQDKKEAISKIFDIYSEKIIRYHKDIKYSLNYWILKKLYYLLNRLRIVESGMGEFVYAKSFTMLHKDYLDHADERLRSFENAYSSLKILREKFEWTLMYSVTFIIFILTVIQILWLAKPIIKIVMRVAPALNIGI